MRKLVMLFALLALSACAEPHGYAVGRNEGGRAGIDVFRIPLP